MRILKWNRFKSGEWGDSGESGNSSESGDSGESGDSDESGDLDESGDGWVFNVLSVERLFERGCHELSEKI